MYAYKSGLTKKATYKLMEAFKDVLTETLLDGERFHIHGLLTLKTEYKEECIRYNPKTREKVVVPLLIIALLTFISNNRKQRFSLKSQNWA